MTPTDRPDTPLGAYAPINLSRNKRAHGEERRMDLNGQDAKRAPARFDTKIVVILQDELPVWKKLNVTAFVVSGIAATADGVVGARYVDGSGKSYLPMFRQPVMVYAASGVELRRTFDRASERELEMSIFTEDLFDTGNDEDNRAAVAAVPTGELRLVGIALRGEKGRVDKALKGLRLHG